MEQGEYFPGSPLMVDGLHIEETESDVIVFDAANKLFHLLNRTAHKILLACNGLRTAEDIAVMVSMQFDMNGQSRDRVINDVSRTLFQFAEKDLIVSVGNRVKSYADVNASDSEKGLVAVSVSGSSMFPVVLSGDKALVKKTPSALLAPGDIIVWWSDEQSKFIAHRIQSINRQALPPILITKGDMRAELDPPIRFDQVLGQIVAVLREGGVQWMKDLDRHDWSLLNLGSSDVTTQPKPSFRQLKVLDLRHFSTEAIHLIGTVEEVSLVLLSPANEAAWSAVSAHDVETILTVPDGYSVFTGQPELIPEMITFLQGKLRLVVSGQLFLTAFASDQIHQCIEHLILRGQAYIRSEACLSALRSVTTIISGDIQIVPETHCRWIGQSLLGPEYIKSSDNRPLVAVGELARSPRMNGFQNSVSVFGSQHVQQLT